MSDRDLRARAERVIEGVQSGAWTKMEMARTILALLERLDRIKQDPTPPLPELEGDDAFSI